MPRSGPRPRPRWRRASGDPVRRRKRGGPRGRQGRRTVRGQLDASLPHGDGAQRRTRWLAVAYEPIWAIGTGKVAVDRRHRRNARARCASGWSPPMASGRTSAHPLRRLGQGRERRRDLRGARRRRRAGRRRQPQGGGFPADRRGRRRQVESRAAASPRCRRNHSFPESPLMFTFLLIVQTLVAASLVGVILMQRSEGGGLGVGGSSSGFMTARGAADFLTRATCDPRRPSSSSCRSCLPRLPARRASRPRSTPRSPTRRRRPAPVTAAAAGRPGGARRPTRRSRRQQRAGSRPSRSPNSGFVRNTEIISLAGLR